MHVVLEIASGPDAGRRTLLKANQRLTVGRTERADFAVPHDGQLSSVHFAVTAADEVCYLEDLGSTNGTALQGTPLAGRVALHHGDMICAGVTEFSVHVEREAEVAEKPARGQAAPAAVAVQATAVPAGERCPARVVQYDCEWCDSGLLRGYATTDDVAPVVVADCLRGAAPLHLICDFNRLDLPLPETTTPPEFLMDWLPEASRGRFSPVVFSASNDVDLLTVIEEAWGQDALIGLYSRLDQPALLRQIRPAAGAFVRPSVLAPQLTVGAAAVVDNLLDGIDAVLIEGIAPDRWNLFFAVELHSKLATLGFADNELPARATKDESQASEARLSR